MRKLKNDKSRLEAEVEELEKKVERMSTMQKQVDVSTWYTNFNWAVSRYLKTSVAFEDCIQ